MSSTPPPSLPSNIQQTIANARAAANDPTQADVDKVIEACNKGNALIEEWQEEISTLQGEIPQWQQDIDNAQSNIADYQAQLTQDAEMLQNYVTQLSGLVPQLKELNTQLATLQQELAGTSDPTEQASLQKQIDSLEGQIATTVNQIQGLLRDVTATASNVSFLKTAISTSETSIEQWTQDITDAQKEIPLMQAGIVKLEALQPEAANWLAHLPSDLRGDVYTMGNTTLQTNVTDAIDKIVAGAGINQTSAMMSQQMLSKQQEEMAQKKAREEERRRENRDLREASLASAGEQIQLNKKDKTTSKHNEEVQRHLLEQCEELSHTSQGIGPLAQTIHAAVDALGGLQGEKTPSPIGKLRPKINLGS